MASGYKGFKQIHQESNSRLKELKKQQEMKSATENLKKFTAFLFKYPTINGYAEDSGSSEIANGSVKKTFKTLGKKTFKELAEYLGLKEFDVHFNPGGPAVSGDLILMGMFTSDKGIYISLNKDGMRSGILYRTIKNMKDYTGGNNNYFEEGELNHPEEIKEKITRLLKLNQADSTSSNDEDASYGFDGTDFGTPEKFKGLLRELHITENYKIGTDPKHPNAHPVYLWQGQHIRIVTANNPILKNGYASFIGIEGSRELVDKAARIIEASTDSFGNPGLEYIDFDFTFSDPINSSNDTPAPSADPTLSVLTGNDWFKRHPEKVLGSTYETTNRFGKPVTKVKGDLKNVETGISVPSRADEVDEDAPLETEIKEPLEKLLSDPEKNKNIERVVNEVKRGKAEKAIRKINGEKEISSDACPDGTLCFEDVIKQYNKNITEEEIKAWVWYKRISGGYNDERVILNKNNGWSNYVIPLHESEKYIKNWMDKGIICYYNGGYLPSVLYYAENIYERQSTLLNEKDAIIKAYGQAQYDRQWKGLENVQSSKLTLTDPVVENRLFIKPDSAFAKEVYIRQLADGTAISVYSAEKRGFVPGAVSLVRAFQEWLRTVPKTDFKKSSQYDITTYYLEGGTPSRHYDKAEKLRLRQNAKTEGDQFFVKFLAEAITREDQLAIEQTWNARYNGYVEIDYFKIPVAFTCSSTFKNKPLFIRSVQREGLGFINVQGSGCIAYDVGLGKTMTGILALAQAMEMGQCKRPFIVVPNQTYKNWLTEIRGVVDKGTVALTGLLPQYQVIDLYNLGTDFLAQLKDENGNIRAVPEYSISVITYEGFNRLSFGEETWEKIGAEFYSILNQGIDKRRDVEKLHERINEMMGRGIRGGMADIEVLGFDFAIVDEAHAMKKAFTQVKGEVKGDDESRDKSAYEIRSGEPSMTALRGFMISQYIQRQNKMRNVLLLTATPFTNSPLEIYSILALIGYEQLEKWGIKNIKQFFDTFIKTSNELIINAKLKPERREIVLGFHNLIALQQLIYKFISYKTGEDAKIQRPNKIVLPMLNKREGDTIVPLPIDEQISTNLAMTSEQREYMSDVESYVRGQTSLRHFCVNPNAYEDEDEDPENAESSKGELLDEKNLSEDEEEGTRILRGMSFARQLALSPYLYACNPDHNPTYIQYIESSPKLQYVMECIRSVKQYHEEHGQEVSGQVIYMNAGVHFFPLIKEYLVSKIGYTDNEVGIIKSGMSAAKKEGIKERFLAGSVKIIIGSASIKEGINLQTRSTVLYNCWLDWNPTDIKQLEGRIWRFGNMFANIRIVNPLMEDSIDTFIFQKLQEKTSRINEIWYRAGKSNTLNLEEFNPAELKMGLITDPYALAELILLTEREKLQDEITGLNNQKIVLTEISEQRETFNKNIGHIKETVNKYKPLKEDGVGRSIETVFKIFKDYLNDAEAEHTYQDQIIYDQIRKANAAIKRGVEQVLAPRGLDITFDLKKLTAQMDKEIEKISTYMEDKTGDAAIKKKGNEIIQERIKKGYKSKTVAERVKEFASLNDTLLSELMVYHTDESKQKRTDQLALGKGLEESADAVEELEAYVKAIEELTDILAELDALRKAA
jgi:hypothetical protein